MSSVLALCPSRWTAGLSFAAKKPTQQCGPQRLSVRAATQQEGDNLNPSPRNAHASLIGKKDMDILRADTDSDQKTTRRAAMGMVVAAAAVSVHVLPNCVDYASAEAEVVDSGSKSQFMDSE